MFKLLFSDAFALECRDRRPRRSATVRPKILSSQGYLWTVEDAGPYGFIFTLTDKPKFEAFRNRLFALKAFTYIDRFSLKMSRRKRKIFKKSATVGGDRCGAGIAGITPR